MSKGFAVFMLGLIVALGGVGGVETSLNGLMLLGSTMISLGGCLLMYVGVTLLKMEDYNA